MTVVPDDDLVEEPFEEPCDEPSGTRTPPTPEVSPSHAPLPPAPPLRQRAMAQLLPVSVPAVIKDMAGKNLAKTLRDFDRHYMPNGRHPTCIGTACADPSNVRSLSLTERPDVSVGLLRHHSAVPLGESMYNSHTTSDRSTTSHINHLNLDLKIYSQ